MKRKFTPLFVILYVITLLFGNENITPALAETAARTDHTVQAAPSAPTPCDTNVAETSLYSVVYQLNIPTAVDYNGSFPAYTVDNTASAGNFSRIGYCLQLDSKWVWVSMDAFTNNPVQTGVPVLSTGAIFQQVVSNMNVASSAGAGVTTGTGITTGNIEFWHHCYAMGAGLGTIPAGNNGAFDFNDSTNGTASCYGSMQIHNYGAMQTIFAWNRWEGGGNGDLGIGNNPGTNPDWTFQQNAGSYTTKVLTVYLLPTSTTTPCDTNVPETSAYSMVYQLNLPVNANYDNTFPGYSINKTASIVGSFSRIGYCLQLDSKWVWVSMDAFTNVPGRTGVPVLGTGAVFQQAVSNMNVASSVGAGVTTGTGITTGNIEFWHHCYSQPHGLGSIPFGNDTLYDFNDSYATNSCYGSMQVHNYGAAQTIFAWNGWDSGEVDQIGIGNSPVGNPDWTFERNAASYTTKVLTVYVLQSSLITPGVAGGNGPGGVGVTNGSSALALWLKPDRGVYVDTACTTAAANGQDVACWKDQSGYGRNFTQATVSNQPNYYTSVLNNQPVLRFNGTSDRLTAGAVLAAGDDTFTYFAGWMSNSQSGCQAVYEQNNATIATGKRAAFLMCGSAYGFNGESNDFHNALPFTIGQYYASTIVVNGGASNNVVVYGNGSSATGTINIGTEDVGTNGGSAVGYKIPSISEFLNGDEADIIVFSDALNNVDRILVENYLSAKYNLPVITDVYNGDTPANGDFDRDMAGIGRYGGNNHTQSHSAGMIVINRSFLQDNGDWLTFGHLTPAAGRTSADLPTTGAWATAPKPMRWARHWYFQRTDAAGTTGGLVDIIFDFSEGNMNNAGKNPAGPVSNYRLLKRANPTGQFTDIAIASAIIGDQVQFLGVNVNDLGSNFTLGTLNDNTSPTAVKLDNLSVSRAHSPALWPWLLFGAAGLLLGLSGAFVLRRQ
jgi:hypothetical protein